MRIPAILGFLVCKIACGQNHEAADAALPGRGLAQHDFLFCGQGDARKPVQTLFLVRDGKVAWTHTLSGKGKTYTDCALLSNGNALFAWGHGVTEVTPEHNVVWNYETPEGAEVYSAQPIGRDQVLIGQCGLPAKIILLNKKTHGVDWEFTVETAFPGDPKKVHPQLRRARMTSAGTILVAHLDRNKVIEYDRAGKVLWSVDAPAAWAAIRLKNGHTLISGNQKGYLREVNSRGEIVWELTRDDLPGIDVRVIQEASRLANGNTVFCNWIGGVKMEDWPKIVQVIEVTPAKQIVWALREWSGTTDLGPASSLQLLDEPGVEERGELQR